MDSLILDMETLVITALVIAIKAYGGHPIITIVSIVVAPFNRSKQERFKFCLNLNFFDCPIEQLQQLLRPPLPRLKNVEHYYSGKMPLPVWPDLAKFRHFGTI